MRVPRAGSRRDCPSAGFAIGRATTTAQRRRSDRDRRASSHLRRQCQRRPSGGRCGCPAPPSRKRCRRDGGRLPGSPPALAAQDSATPMAPGPRSQPSATRGRDIRDEFPVPYSFAIWGHPPKEPSPQAITRLIQFLAAADAKNLPGTVENSATRVAATWSTAAVGSSGTAGGTGTATARPLGRVERDRPPATAGPRSCRLPVQPAPGSGRTRADSVLGQLDGRARRGFGSRVTYRCRTCPAQGRTCWSSNVGLEVPAFA
jgi:hypothetical protein